MISGSLELAETYARLDRAGDAAKALVGAVTPEVTLLPEQQVRLMVVAAAVAQPALKARGAGRPDVEAERAAGALLELAVSRGQRLPPELHEMRLLLKAASPGATSADLLEACDLAAMQAPELGVAPQVRVARMLGQSGRAGVAQELLTAARKSHRKPAVAAIMSR